MRPGFYLKCGLHWTAVSEVYGGYIAVCASPDHATCFTTRQEAQRVREWLESQVYGAPHEVVEIALEVRSVA